MLKLKSEEGTLHLKKQLAFEFKCLYIRTHLRDKAKIVKNQVLSVQTVNIKDIS